MEGGAGMQLGGTGVTKESHVEAFFFTVIVSHSTSLELVKYQIISLALGWCYYKLDSQLLDSTSECLLSTFEESFVFKSKEPNKSVLQSQLQSTELGARKVYRSK